MSLVGNGSDAYGYTGNTADVSGGPWTIEIWLKPTANPYGAGQGSGILTKWQSTNWQDGCWAIFDDRSNRRFWGEQSGGGNYGAGATDNNTIVNNVWGHYAWYHGAAGENKFYYNGALQWSTDVLSLNSKTWPLWLMRAYSIAPNDGTNSYFQGKVAELRIWSDERTVTEILQNMYRRANAGDAGMLHYWPLNESAGATATDIVASGAINFTLAGSYAWDTGDNPPFRYGGYGIL